MLTVEILEPDSCWTWLVGEYYYEGSAFWINEGMGVDYFIHLHSHEIPGPGVYTFTGVIGHYYRGDGYTTDDDEEWEYDQCRPATPKERAALGI